MKIKRSRRSATVVGFVRSSPRTARRAGVRSRALQRRHHRQILHRQVAPWALGADALDIAALVDPSRSANTNFPGSYLCRALAASTPRSGTCAASARARACASCSAAAAAASGLRVVDEARHHAGGRGRRSAPARPNGFDAFKFRIGAECGHDVDEWPGRTEEIVPAVRKALGDEVDAARRRQQRLLAGRAIEVGRLLQDNGISHLEEPCPYWELEQTKEVATPSTSTSPAASRTADPDLAPDDRACAPSTSSSPTSATSAASTRTLRVAAHGARRPATLHAAQRQPLAW